MPRSVKGFSMLELLVVLVIVGILAVVTGTWYYGADQPVAVKGTVNSLVGILAEARTVARSTGRTVTLTTLGTQATLRISFLSQGDVVIVPPATPAITTWRRDASGTGATKYSGIENVGWPVMTQAAPNPDPLTGGVPSIAALFTNGVPPGAAGNLFKGALDSTFSFDSTGRASQDFWVYVGGMRASQSYPGAPVGLVLVTRANGIHSFYKPNAGDATVPWQRL